MIEIKRYHPSKFDIRYSIFCGSLFSPAAKAASLIIKKQCHFGVVSYERCRWPRASSLIGKETFGARFLNRPLLGFVFGNTTGNM
jgi:hypothetical protein